MAKKVIKKGEKKEDHFKSLYKVLKNNIQLREISIDEIGTFAENYDKKHLSNWDKLIKKLRKKKTFSQIDLIDLTEMSQKHPHQSNLFKRNMIVSVVTVIDEVFSEVIKHYYFNHQSKLSLDKLTITFKQLNNFTDIKDIKNHLIEREINNILFKEGVKNRLKFFNSELGLEIPKSNEHIAEFNKLIKLRNLVVHNGCTADKYYAKNYGDSGFKEGDEIEIKKEYLHDALGTCFYICGFILQSAQLTMHKNSLNQGDNFLNELAHELLKKNKFSYLEEIYNSSIEMEIDESNKKMIAINYCVGLKLQKKSKKSIERVLDNYDWTAVDETFLLAIHALRNEDDLFYKKLQKGIKDKNISIQELREWAIFSLYNNKKKYRDIIKEIDLK